LLSVSRLPMKHIIEFQSVFSVSPSFSFFALLPLPQSGIPFSLLFERVRHWVSTFPHVQFAFPFLFLMIPFLTSACFVMSQWYVCLDLS
jgi:hypothetical protein